MSEKKVSRQTGIVYATKVIDALLQLMIFDISLMLILIGFFGRTDIGAVRCTAAVGLPAALLYIVRGWCPNRAVTIAAHAVSAVYAFVTAPDEVARMAYIVIVAVMIIYSISIMLGNRNHTSEHIPIGMAAVFVGALIIGQITDRALISEYSMYFGVAFIFLQVIYRNLNNLNGIMTMNNDTGNFPAKQMVRVDIFIMAVVSVLCAGVMVIANNSYVYRMLGVFRQLFIIVLRFIFSFFKGDGEAETVIEETSAAQPESGSDYMQIQPESGLWQDILNGIALIIGVVVIAAAIVGIFVAVVRMMKRMRGGSGIDGDVREFVAPSDEKSFRMKRRVHREKKGDSANMKARKLYKSMVQKNAASKREKISSNMTPKEISSSHIMTMQDEITGIYEKARYSNEEVSPDDIELLKKSKKIQKGI